MKKKLGPLPVWAWAIIAGGIIGGVILMSRRGQQYSDGAPVGSDTAGSIDPTTGLPYAGGVGDSGGLVGGGSSPISSVTDTAAVIQGLKDAGLWPDVATQGAPAPMTGLFDIPAGKRFYDPVTGDIIDGPEAAAANSSGDTNSSEPKAAQTVKKSAVDRAKDAVAKGAVGPVNRRRLRAAGYTDAQIDYHRRRKTPLGQPGKPKGAAPKPKNGRAPSHPNEHRTAAPPSHDRATPPAKRYTEKPGKDSHGRPGTWHIYPDHKVFVPR